MRPSTSLAEIARGMIEHKHGAVIVSELGLMLGIFTTVDALRALATLATEQAQR